MFTTLGNEFVSGGVTIGNEYYFVNDANNTINALWKTDCTVAGTEQLFQTIGSGDTIGSESLFNDKFLFSVVNQNAPGQLWISDGTTAGTTQIGSSISPGDYTEPGPATTVGNTAYFALNDGTTGKELWQTDGTIAGLSRVADVAAGVASSNPTWITAVNSEAVFAADDGVHGDELWTTAPDSSTSGGGDGTGSGGTTRGGSTLNNLTTLTVTPSIASKTIAVGNAKGVAKVLIVKSSGATVDGTVTVDLLLSSSTDGASANTLETTSLTLKKRKASKHVVVPIAFNYPADAADGTQYVLASVDGGSTLPMVGGSGVSAAINYRHAYADWWPSRQKRRPRLRRARR